MLTVYLDSSDYSVLSDPRCATTEIQVLRERLLEFSRSGVVEFRFSAAHICEISPTAPAYTDMAAERAELLFALCGHKALIAFSELLRQELLATAFPASPRPVATSDTGDWFPDLSGIASPVSWLERIKDVDEDLKKRGANRAMRRALKRQAFPRNRPARSTRELLEEEHPKAMVELLENYPMRQEDAEVLARYVVGDASRDDWEKAFLSSLRDPQWMIRWFHRHGEKLTPVTEWIRKPSARLQALLQDAASKVSELRVQAQASGSEARGRVPAPRQRIVLQESLLMSVARKLSEALHIEASESFSAQVLAERAPGLSVCIAIAVGLRLSILGTTPRKPKHSDFADAIHAIYAPYVDIFRCDAFMAPIIGNASAQYGTTVVGRLGELTACIERRLDG